MIPTLRRWKLEATGGVTLKISLLSSPYPRLDSLHSEVMYQQLCRWLEITWPQTRNCSVTPKTRVIVRQMWACVLLWMVATATAFVIKVSASANKAGLAPTAGREVTSSQTSSTNSLLWMVPNRLFSNIEKAYILVRNMSWFSHRNNPWMCTSILSQPTAKYKLSLVNSITLLHSRSKAI